MGNMFTEIGLTHYLTLSAVLFVLGIVVVMTRRNAIGVLMGLELLLNAAGINFVAFNKYSAPNASTDRYSRSSSSSWRRPRRPPRSRWC